MARTSVEERIRSVILYLKGVKEAREITTILETSIRTRIEDSRRDLQRQEILQQEEKTDVTLTLTRFGDINCVTLQLSTHCDSLSRDHPLGGCCWIECIVHQFQDLLDSVEMSETLEFPGTQVFRNSDASSRMRALQSASSILEETPWAPGSLRTRRWDRGS